VGLWSRSPLLYFSHTVLLPGRSETKRVRAAVARTEQVSGLCSPCYSFRRLVTLFLASTKRCSAWKEESRNTKRMVFDQPLRGCTLYRKRTVLSPQRRISEDRHDSSKIKKKVEIPDERTSGAWQGSALARTHCPGRRRAFLFRPRRRTP